MRARILGLVAVLLAAGCIRLGKPPTPPVMPIASPSVRVNGIEIEIEVGWMPKGTRQVTLLVTVFNTSVLRSDDLAVDIDVHGFALADGRPRWSGLVPIRSKIYQEVTYTMPVDARAGRIDVAVRRKRSPMPFWRTELRFSRSGGSVRLVSSSAPR
ncbi:MAG: hypothetical protein AAGF11_54715 [Myxococcota bacterium]